MKSLLQKGTSFRTKLKSKDKAKQEVKQIPSFNRTKIVPPTSNDTPKTKLHVTKSESKRGRKFLSKMGTSFKGRLGTLRRNSRDETIKTGPVEEANCSTTIDPETSNTIRATETSPPALGFRKTHGLIGQILDEVLFRQLNDPDTTLKDVNTVKELANQFKVVPAGLNFLYQQVCACAWPNGEDDSNTIDSGKVSELKQLLSGAQDSQLIQLVAVSFAQPNTVPLVPGIIQYILYTQLQSNQLSGVTATQTLGAGLAPESHFALRMIFQVLDNVGTSRFQEKDIEVLALRIFGDTIDNLQQAVDLFQFMELHLGVVLAKNGTKRVAGKIKIPSEDWSVGREWRTEIPTKFPSLEVKVGEHVTIVADLGDAFICRSEVSCGKLGIIPSTSVEILDPVRRGIANIERLETVEEENQISEDSCNESNSDLEDYEIRNSEQDMYNEAEDAVVETIEQVTEQLNAPKQVRFTEQLQQVRYIDARKQSQNKIEKETTIEHQEENYSQDDEEFVDISEIDEATSDDESKEDFESDQDDMFEFEIQDSSQDSHAVQDSATVIHKESIRTTHEISLEDQHGSDIEEAESDNEEDESDNEEEDDTCVLEETEDGEEMHVTQVDNLKTDHSASSYYITDSAHEASMCSVGQMQFDFKGIRETDLELEIGDTVFLVETYSDGWCFGELKDVSNILRKHLIGNCGEFPASYVDIIGKEEYVIDEGEVEAKSPSHNRNLRNETPQKEPKSKRFGVFQAVALSTRWKGSKKKSSREQQSHGDHKHGEWTIKQEQLLHDALDRTITNTWTNQAERSKLVDELLDSLDISYLETLLKQS